jgi:transposase
MSLRAPLFYAIPEQTAEVARAAFPKGNPYMRIRDALGPIYTNPEFAALFPNDGRPAQAPAQLALVTVMQFAEALSDLQTADAVRSRIDWKYALALELTDPGFDATILCEFRRRLIAGNAELLLFESMLMLFRDQGLVKARGRQRTDSTHVLAAIHALNRLELLAETVRHVLNRLATVAPEWLRNWVPADWFDRYGRPISDYRLPSSKAERERLTVQFGADGRRLLTTLYDPATPRWLRELAPVQTLRQVWLQQFYAVAPGQVVQVRKKDDLPPAALLICSPYDPEARYRCKRSTEWVGYAVHLTESCDDELPHLITDVATTPATTADNQLTGAIQARLAERELPPAEHFVDAGYMSADHLVSSQEQHTDLIGPVIEDQSWQARAGEGFGVAQFSIDWDQQYARCPQGKTSVIWKPTRDSDGHEVISIRFAHADCRGCSVREHCVKTERPRAIMIRPQAQHEALQAARARQHTDDFKEQYRARAGVEGTISQGVRISDLRRSGTSD